MFRELTNAFADFPLVIARHWSLASLGVESKSEGTPPSRPLGEPGADTSDIDEHCDTFYRRGSCKIISWSGPVKAPLLTLIHKSFTKRFKLSTRSSDE